MANEFGMHVRFTAQPGKGDELAALLLQAADGLGSTEECLVYIVSRSPEDPDTLWVTEAWTSQEAHGSSLQNEETRALIARAMPLIAGTPEATRLEPVGGKGL